MSTNWIDLKYVNLLSTKLDKFKSTSRGVWNFRCPICMDSAKSKSKARGYIYAEHAELKYHCHNCGTTLWLSNFIRIVDEALYLEYKREKYIENGSNNSKTDDEVKADKAFNSNALQSLRRVSQLEDDHPTKKYVNSRCIPELLHSKLYHCTKFKSWVNTVVPDTFETLENENSRLIIPFFNKIEMHAFQGRALNSSDIKYITIVLNETVPKIYGLDVYDPNYHGYVVEGPIDSMFLPNCVATAGGDIVTGIRELNHDKLTVVYDNEPRNKHTVKKIRKAIKNGYKVCIWPNSIKEKDINDMILSGIKSDQIKAIIDENSVSGLDAELRLSLWKRIN